MVPLHSRANCLSAAEGVVSYFVKMESRRELTNTKIAEADRNFDASDKNVVHNLDRQCSLDEGSHLVQFQDLPAISHTILSHDPDVGHVSNCKHLSLISFSPPATKYNLLPERRS